METNTITMQGGYPPAGFFDDIKAMFRETDLKFKETERIIKENAERFDRSIAELKLAQDRTDQSAEKALKGIGSIRNTIGLLVEHLMTPDLTNKFQAMGYTFTRYARNIVINDKAKNILAEADMMLENGGYVLLIEVKTNLLKEHIPLHAERMERFRRNANLHGDKRKFLGAIAAPAIEEPFLTMVYDAGFFPITASEDSVEVHSQQGFKPKEW